MEKLEEPKTIRLSFLTTLSFFFNNSKVPVIYLSDLFPDFSTQLLTG